MGSDSVNKIWIVGTELLSKIGIDEQELVFDSEAWVTIHGHWIDDIVNNDVGNR